MALLDIIRELLAKRQNSLPAIPVKSDEPPYFETFPVGKELPVIPAVRPRIAPPIIPSIEEPVALGEQDLPPIANDDAPNLARPSATEIARQKVQGLMNEKPVDNDKSFMKKVGAFAREALLGARDASIAKGGKADIWELLGGGVGGTGRYAIDPTVDEQRTLAKNQEEALKNYQISATMEDFATGQKVKESQIANTKADNEYNQAVLQDRSEGRTAKMRQDSLKKLTGLKYYDPNNVAHKKLAEQSGLNTEALQGWDDRKRDRKQVAGQWFIEKTPNSGIYEQADIPVDESKTMVDYVVEMPPDNLGKREKRTYRVAQKDAANFSTQMSALGARLEQSESQFSRRLALDTAKFTQAKGEFERVIGLRQQQFDALQQARAQGNANAERDYQLKLDQYDAMLEKMLTASRSAFDLDESQKADIEEFVRSKRP